MQQTTTTTTTQDQQQRQEMPNLEECFVFAKTPQGTWGIRGPSGRAPGARVTVMKKDGSTATITIGESISKVDTYSIQRDAAPTAPSSSPSSNNNNNTTTTQQHNTTQTQHKYKGKMKVF